MEDRADRMWKSVSERRVRRLVNVIVVRFPMARRVSMDKSRVDSMNVDVAAMKGHCSCRHRLDKRARPTLDPSSTAYSAKKDNASMFPDWDWDELPLAIVSRRFVVVVVAAAFAASDST
eukprot:CCRYP_000052-RA/>CCRYP_000052-RA protein AED:0.34 eAED:0.42 QI:0/0/0.5/1/0/0/2/772/118